MRRRSQDEWLDDLSLGDAGTKTYKVGQVIEGETGDKSTEQAEEHLSATREAAFKRLGPSATEISEYEVGTRSKGEEKPSTETKSTEQTKGQQTDESTDTALVETIEKGRKEGLEAKPSEAKETTQETAKSEKTELPKFEKSEAETTEKVDEAGQTITEMSESATSEKPSTVSKPAEETAKSEKTELPKFEKSEEAETTETKVDEAGQTITEMSESATSQKPSTASTPTKETTEKSAVDETESVIGTIPSTTSTSKKKTSTWSKMKIPQHQSHKDVQSIWSEIHPPSTTVSAKTTEGKKEESVASTYSSAPSSTGRSGSDFKIPAHRTSKDVKSIWAQLASTSVTAPKKEDLRQRQDDKGGESTASAETTSSASMGSSSKTSSPTRKSTPTLSAASFGAELDAPVAQTEGGIGDESPKPQPKPCGMTTSSKKKKLSEGKGKRRRSSRCIFGEHCPTPLLSFHAVEPCTNPSIKYCCRRRRMMCRCGIHSDASMYVTITSTNLYALLISRCTAKLASAGGIFIYEVFSDMTEMVNRCRCT